MTGRTLPHLGIKGDKFRLDLDARHARPRSIRERQAYSDGSRRNKAPPTLPTLKFLEHGDGGDE